jgi:hypothetical protein
MAQLFYFMAMPHRPAIPEGTVHIWGAGGGTLRRAERGIKVRNTIKGNGVRHAPMYSTVYLPSDLFTFRAVITLQGFDCERRRIA